MSKSNRRARAHHRRNAARDRAHRVYTPRLPDGAWVPDRDNAHLLMAAVGFSSLALPLYAPACPLPRAGAC